jgi:hypothetical protein
MVNIWHIYGESVLALTGLEQAGLLQISRCPIGDTRNLIECLMKKKKQVRKYQIYGKDI